jgi:opacity protein-like surface antigen
MNHKPMRMFLLGALLALPLAAAHAQDNPQPPGPQDGIFYWGPQNQQNRRDDWNRQRDRPEQRQRQENWQRRESGEQHRSSNRHDQRPDQRRQRDRASVPN